MNQTWRTSIFQLHTDADLKAVDLSVKICNDGIPLEKPLRSRHLIMTYGTNHGTMGNPFLIPYVEKIPLKIPLSMRAVRVVIHSAEGLVSCKTNKPPSAYASVYLLGDQERYYLTAKTKETKTTVIDNNADPVWEQEFILHGPQGLEGVTALRVLKDQGSGIWRQ